MTIGDRILLAIGIVTIVYWWARLLLPVMEWHDCEKERRGEL